MLPLNRIDVGVPGVKHGNCTLLFMPGRRGNCSFLVLLSGEEGEEGGCSAMVSGWTSVACELFFFFLGRVSQLFNGASDLSVLTDGTPCVGKSRSQRVGAFTC